MVEQGQELCFSHTFKCLQGTRRWKSEWAQRGNGDGEAVTGAQGLSVEVSWGQLLSMAIGWECKPVLPRLLSFQDITEIHISMWDGPGFRRLSNPFYNQVLLVDHIFLRGPWVYHSCPRFSLLRRLVVRLIRMCQGNIFIPLLRAFYFIHLSVF